MMEKFLLSLSEDQAAGGEAILNTIKFSVPPIAKVFHGVLHGFSHGLQVLLQTCKVVGRKLLPFCSGLIFSVISMDGWIVLYLAILF